VQNTTLDTSFLDRLKQILANRYGKDLQIRQLLNTSELQNEKDIFVRGRDLHIPIKVNGSLLGTAVVPSADDLDSEKSQSIAQLIRMVLEPALYRWYLTQRESNLEEINKAELSVENVYLFGETKQERQGEAFIETSYSHLDLGPSSEISALSARAIHLEGSSEKTHKKVALMIHEMSGHWAFVPFNDIKNQLHCVADIAKLGSMTIYIEDVETLNPSEQELLLNYTSEIQDGNVPLFISTTKLKADELYSCNKLKDILTDKFMANSFDVDRAPLSNKELKQVLELFFFSSDGPIDA
jgi:hypothetical protein